MLTVKEVAAALSVSTATVYELVRRGELAHVRLLNSIRISVEELRRRLLKEYRRADARP